MPSDTANPATVLIAAESIDLAPTAAWQDADAAVRTARSAHDEQDLVLLLAALGLPNDEVELARLAPHVATAAGTAGRPDHHNGGTTVSHTRPATEPTEQGDVLADLDPMTREVVLSMRAKGDSPLKILAATGLDESDVRRLIAHRPDTAEPASPHGSAVDGLLAWGEQHPQAKVQRLAEQARQSLDKLLVQRAADHAVAAHEGRVAALKAQLQRAEQALRDAKAAKTTPKAGAAGGSDLPQPPEKATRNAIRIWAAEHGHTVADRGVIPQTVLRAWYDAHPDTLAQAG
ncbi:hypothetical protein GCM10009665_25140 [Kitasatospora nipponensis]|uniref:Lsr2 DNA-binding domain-containing protein n=1 Tax=Kitasatospora nipponensis TaxID=258049 RepID=A0ABN1W8Y4_9ACTN